MTVAITRKIEDLKRSITTLEWDLLKIKNDELRNYKERLLNSYKKELQDMINQIECSSYREDDEGGMKDEEE